MMMVQSQNGDELLGGIHAVLYAFFRQDETVDEDALHAQVEHCLEVGCDGITVLGLATEVLKLTPVERRRIVEIVSKSLAGRKPLSVTIAGNSVAEQVELLRFAEENGADWVILQPTLAGSYDAEVYLEMFERVATNTELPVAIQNAPAYLGRSLSNQDIARLKRRCPSLAAVKSEDSALGVRCLIEESGNGLSILGGRGGLDMLDLLQAGCTGFILAPDVAHLAVRVHGAWREGRQSEARQLHADALQGIAFVMQSLEHLVTYGKRIHAETLGLHVHDRAPCLAPTDFGLQIAREHGARMRKLLESSNS